jgi:uncharacterized GH25 family protein
VAASKTLAAALRALALGLVGIRQVLAHDFWVQPSSYWVAPAARTPVTLEVGHGPDRQRSPIRSSRITLFEAIGSQGTRIDLRPLLRLGGPNDDGAIILHEPGTYVLVLQTDARAHSLLPAIRFNDYLRVEGLTPALRFRALTHRTDADGSEAYSRQAKLIVKVGTQLDAQTPVTRALGLPLEIVPELDPYTNPEAKDLPVHVIYRRQPLAGALVKLTNLEHDANPVEMHVTDRMGRAIFNAPHSGSWLLNVIWTEIAPPTSDSDFETTFSSLSFGFTEAQPGMISYSLERAERAH